MIAGGVSRGERAAAVEAVMVTALDGSRRTERADQVVGEEPLEIRLGGPGQIAAPIAVTMRTPGHDFELAVGFLIAEGLLEGQGDLTAVRYCELPDGEPQRYNIVTVSTRRPVDVGARQRQTTVSASCGICGTASLEQLEDRCPAVAPGQPIEASVLTGLPDRLRQHQRVFERTGGLHGAGLYDHTGAMLAVREDIGRHNAVDKLVGWAAMQGRLPLSSVVLVVSGRVSFEIIQKAAVAGLATVVAVSAPSSLAVTTARRMGMTLAGFVRNGRANLYTGAQQVLGSPAATDDDRSPLPT
jgi:FdhD protein